MGPADAAIAQTEELSIESNARVQLKTDTPTVGFGDKAEQGIHANFISGTSLPNPADTNRPAAGTMPKI